MKINLSRLLICLCGAMMLAGCYDPNQVRAFLREPRSPVSGAEYRLLPPDVVSIRSLHVAEINGISQRIRPDGKINLPLLGEVTVAGLTPAEVEKELMRMASEYYEKTDATVEVAGYNSQKYYIMGQVARPGPVAWTGHDTVLDALAMAQPTQLAWPERIVLTRGDEPQEGGFATSEPSDKYRSSGEHPEALQRPRHQITINLFAMIKSGDMSNNVMLKPGDVLYVPANPFGAVGLAMQNLLFPVRPVLETARVPATISNANQTLTNP